MTDAFSSTADFSGMSNERVSVSRIVQRAIIEVDETGTKAAAATMYARFSRSTSIVLNVDRPFYFSIKYGDLTLFQGHVVNPMKG
ncbi:alpha-1-antitrypsin homolog [Copidosoma floridanum]|uniref:alpha-1-antitrypsin homolog n=1 Tax=Copidosoma floridanum TaxID=29053 RepID=UPI0006C99069|nr:alpha-1-antitrypsin homolog [Copidosoma floridanum]